MKITNRMLKKSLSALLSIVLLLSLVQPQVIGAASGQGNTQLNNMIEHTVQYYKDYYNDASNQDAVSDSWWELVALWSAGQDLHDGTWKLPAWEKKEPRRYRPQSNGTEQIQYIFGLLSMGRDPEHAWETNRNLWSDLASQQNQTTGSFGAVNKHIWSILALNAGLKRGQDVGVWKDDASRQKALKYLLSAQYADGGFGLEATGSTGDTDITGMALLALGQYQGDSAVEQAIERAKNLLMKRQLNSAGFASESEGIVGDENSNSLSTSVSGLIASGEDVFGSRWTKNGKTFLDAYSQFQKADGSFAWLVKDTDGNGMATQQALTALLDIQSGESVWSRIADAKPLQNYRSSILTTSQIDNGAVDPEVEITLSGDLFRVESTKADSWSIDVGTTGLKLKEISKLSNEKVKISFSGRAKAGTVAIQSLAGTTAGIVSSNVVSIRIEAPKPVGLVTLSVERRTLNEPDILVPTAVPIYEGETAFSILKKVLEEQGIELEFQGKGASVYVESIDDLWEKDHGDGSGWVYTVNGVAPKSSAGAYPLKDGDILRWQYTKNLGKDIEDQDKPNQPNDKVIQVDEKEQRVEIGSPQDELSSNKTILVFPKQELPHVTSVTSSTYLEIESNTVVISPAWDKKLELPHSGDANNEALLAKVNEVLSHVKKETENIDLRVKLGGDQDIQFNQHVTLVLKGQGDNEAGYLDASGTFTAIQKYDDASVRNDDAYSYGEQGELVIKTRHFSEFVTYITKAKEGNGGTEVPGGDNGTGTEKPEVPGGDNGTGTEKPEVPGGDKGTGTGNGGGVVVPPFVADTITFSVEKRSIGAGDIIAPMTVPLQDGDTAFTVLERVAAKSGISIDREGRGSSIYVWEIDGLRAKDLSGWMYSVNGTFPKYSAGIYRLNKGDVLRWQYTTNLGKDIGDNFEGDTKVPVKPNLPGGIGVPDVTDQGGKELTPKQKETSAKLQALLNSTSAWVQNNRQFTAQDSFVDWDAIALARSGKQVPSAYYTALENFVKEKQGEFRLVTDYERIALVVSAIGKDPSNVAGYNLLEKIYNNARMTNQGINGLVFGLLALDANKSTIPNDAQWTRDKLIQQLLNQQNTDGGFPLSKESSAASDIDMTAMSLQALAKYQERKEVKVATDKALAWLSSKQLPNGGFKAWGVETSESISQVIVALSSLGIDLEDKRFVQNGGGLLQALRTYANKDGGFAHGRGEASNYMATQQALLALAAYDRFVTNRSSLYDMTDAASTSTQKPKDVKITYTDETSISAWAKEAVNKATELGFMQGTNKDKDTSKFEPKRELSRAEFAALIVKYAGLQPLGTDSGFTDISAKSWYAGYVAAAKDKGLISGTSATKFAPNQAISREEMATVLVRMKGLPKSTETSTALKDQKQVSAWALPYVKYAYQAGLMSGDDGYFKPQQHVTREMAAVVMVRLHSDK
ncbi:hypothetical protein BBG47_06335 [Paenibacillus sp. KS1]|uniref:DUF4430 domain-containing protein n=1 Tax=Paenibacillus sp. KS1 TaxID=1849249 RepID=UPI00080669E5|nr:DUF4430 domain-containing protein [Paenibacillus sp. KS1]OBY80477.1 hypothetical protein BBG47_06335 [Paenibacillus sp. KS1]